MRHVDEGVLHAWLDGALEAMAEAGGLPAGESVATVEAHLRTCGHCQALVERERAIRDGAAHILLDAAPATVDAPPFEHIMAGTAAGTAGDIAGDIAGGGPTGPVTDGGAGTALSRARPAGARYRVMPLAWAASVVLALGAGWWGSMVWRDGAGGTDTSIARDVAAEDAGSDPAAPLPLASGEPAATVRALAAAAPGDEPARPAGEPAAVASARPGAGATAPVIAAAPEAAVAPAARRPPDAPIGAPRGQADVIASDELARPASAAPPPAVPLGNAVAASRDAATAREEPALAIDPVTTGITALAPMTVSSSAGGGVARGAQPATLQMLPTAGRLAGRTAADASADAVPIQRTPLPMFTFRDAVADARAGLLYWRPATGPIGDMLVIRGAVVDGVEVTTLYDGSVMGRVWHRLADGAMVELIQWQDPDEPRTRAAPMTASPTALFLNTSRAPDGRNEVLMRVPALGAFVMVTADLDAETLVRLADALVVESRK